MLSHVLFHLRHVLLEVRAGGGGVSLQSPGRAASTSFSRTVPAGSAPCAAARAPSSPSSGAGDGGEVHRTRPGTSPPGSAASWARPPQTPSSPDKASETGWNYKLAFSHLETLVPKNIAFFSVQQSQTIHILLLSLPPPPNSICYLKCYFLQSPFLCTAL